MRGSMRLSLIIPTRNRLAYLKKCLPVALAGLPSNCELIIGENNCTDSTKEYLEQFKNNERIIILESWTTLSMSENFERCINAASGKYIIIIGDDDIVVPLQLDRALQVAQDLNYPDAILQPNWFYDWPIPGKGSSGLLAVEIGMNENAIRYNMQSARMRSVSEIEYGCLPDIYHGIIKRSVIQQCSRYQSKGPLIRASSPDVYLSITLSYFIDNAFILPFSYTVKGASFLSNAASFTSNQNRDRVDEFLFQAKNLYGSKAGNCFISNIHEHFLVSGLALGFKSQLTSLRPHWMSLATRAAKHTASCKGKSLRIASFFKYAFYLSSSKDIGKWKYSWLELLGLISVYLSFFFFWSARSSLKPLFLVLLAMFGKNSGSAKPVQAVDPAIKSPIAMPCISEMAATMSSKYRHPIKYARIRVPNGSNEVDVLRLIAMIAAGSDSH